MLKQLHFKTMLLLCALIAGVSSAWAQEEVTITSFSNASQEGWTITNADYATAGGGYYKLISSDASIVSPSITWSNYTDITITISARKFGGPDATQGKISVSQGDTELATYSPTGTSIVASSALAISPTTGTITISCPGASSSKGCGVQSVVIKGKEIISPNEPSVVLSETSLDFGKVNFGETKELTFTITPANLTTDLTIECDNNKYEVTPTSVASSVSSATTISVTAKPTVLTDDMNGAITISGGGLKANKTVTLQTIVADPNANDGSAEHPYTVAEARAAIDSNEGITNVYATGIVSEIVTAFSSQYGNISYNISDDGETTSAQLQAFRGKGLDGADFTSADDIQVGDIVVVYGNLKKFNSTYEFDQNNQLVSLYRIPVAQKADAELIVADAFNMEVTTTKAIDDKLYLTDSDGEVTVTSSDPTVVKVENGELVALAKGSAVITISVAATDEFKAVSKTINVTVTVKDAVQPEGAGAGSGYVLVTDASTLADGDRLLITSTGTYTASKVTYNFSWAMAEQEGTIRKTADITIEDNKISTVPNNAQVVTLETAPDGKWYLKVDDNNYLNSSNKGVATSTTKEAFGISITENMATISGNDIYLQCNPNSGNARFAFYSSTQKPIQLFRAFDATSFDITVTAAGWRTLVTAVDATLPEGLTAYVVTEVADNAIKLATATDIKANTPYILEGAVGDYTLTAAESATAPATNLLQISTETTGNGVYVLANDDTKGVGFYKWVGGSLGAGRVYLPAPTNAPEFLSFVFDSETTGINDVRGKMADVRGDFFDLQGRKVAQPTKGLYIVNGRKVIK
jgi:hypothetical protein